ncbi:hypothetical protein LA080_009449 [Diaporthe eres]|nr:hypothetical protein LA080_009449 [Diaporthe eres]
MPPEGRYTSLPPRPQRDSYRSGPSPFARGSPTPRLSKHSAELPMYSAAYPDRNESWTSKLRASGEGIYPTHVAPVDVPPDRNHPEVVSPLSNTQQAPPRLQKSHTMPPGYVPQAQTTASMPYMLPLNRAFTMQPEHEYSSSVEKHRSARRRMSFDEEDDYYPIPPIQAQIASRMINAKYKDPYATEDVATSRRYNEDDEFYDDSDDDSGFFNREPYRMPFRHSAPRAPRSPYPFAPRHPGFYGSRGGYDEDGDPSGSASAVGRAHGVRPLGPPPPGTGRYKNVYIRPMLYRDSDSGSNIDSDGDSDSDDSRNMYMPDTSRTLATSLLSQSSSGRSASHGGLSRGHQLFRPMKARRLAGVANRGTISKDNTIGDEARTADILANGGKKICKMPQSMKKLPPIQTASPRSDSNDGIARPDMEELFGRAADSPENASATHAQQALTGDSPLWSASAIRNSDLMKEKERSQALCECRTEMRKRYEVRLFFERFTSDVSGGLRLGIIGRNERVTTLLFAELSALREFGVALDGQTVLASVAT